MNRAEWAAAFLGHGGWPATDENVLAVVAWASAEGSEAIWNPLDTTLPQPGATDFNSVGVKNYPDLDTGLRASVETLAPDEYGYPAIREALAAGNDGNTVAQAVDQSQWGTRNVTGVLAQVRANPDPYREVTIAGSSPDPAPQPQPQSQGDEPVGLTAILDQRDGLPQGRRIRLHADGGIFLDGFAEGELPPPFTIWGSDDSHYTFPVDVDGAEVISYPGLPEQDRQGTRTFSIIRLGLPE